MIKRLPTMQETRVRSLGQEDPLEKEMAAHSNTLAWKIPSHVVYMLKFSHVEPSDSIFHETYTSEACFLHLKFAISKT